ATAYTSKPRWRCARALKTVDVTDLGGSKFLRLPANTSEEKHHEGQERSASRSDVGAYGGDVGDPEPAENPQPSPAGEHSLHRSDVAQASIP
ncbi:MAG TPA: hypothetical protein VK561_01290, partial [Bradyrhizobium sp.]|nr:hypothetical protein [Bradyrhizobium sp.]